MLLHLIADFGAGDLAFAEVTQRLHLHVPEAQVVRTPVPPFSTLAVGFCVAQLALAPAPRETVVFHNVAPRRDDRNPRRDQAGEALACATTPTGVTVVGVNAGHAFSFLRDAGIEVRQVVVSAAGSQFRSRDVFPEAVARVLAGDDGSVGDVLDRDAIPPVPDQRIAYIDGFGNMKTTVRAGGREPGSRVRITIAGVSREAVVAGGGFGVPEGELAFAAGSSGWPVTGGHVRWTEVFLRGGSAWEAFRRPASGAELTIDAMPMAS